MVRHKLKLDHSHSENNFHLAQCQTPCFCCCTIDSMTLSQQVLCFLDDDDKIRAKLNAKMIPMLFEKDEEKVKRRGMSCLLVSCAEKSL